jgi:hypothetical protein
MGLARFFIPCLTVFLIFIPQGFIYAASLLSDPLIPDGEKITYALRRGDENSTVVEEVRVKKDGEKSLYEITSSSKLLDRKIKLLRETMAIVSIHTVRKFQDATLDSVLTVIDEKPTVENGAMKLADFSILTYILRGFPFGTLENLKVGYYGEQKRNSYSMSVKCKGRERITVKGRTFDCYKLEFSMDGFIGTFLSKMNAWYSVEASHYLVYYEGPDGPPGTPKRIMEMVQYTKPSPRTE